MYIEDVLKRKDFYGNLIVRMSLRNFSNEIELGVSVIIYHSLGNTQIITCLNIQQVIRQQQRQQNQRYLLLTPSNNQ